MFDEATTLGTLTVHNAPEAPMMIPFNDDDMAERFALLEILVALHHASEALLRLVLAHKGIPPLPWLELSQQRNFGNFKAEVAKLRAMSREKLENLVGPVVIGNPETTETQRSNATTTYAQIVRQAAIHFLDESNLYNAAKHGLAVNPGHVSFTMTHEPVDTDAKTRTTTLADGGALEYLESITHNSTRVSQLTTSMIDLARLSTFVALVCETMASLWSIVRATYVGDSTGRVALPQWTLDELLPGRTVGPMRRFSDVLGTEASSDK